MRKTGSALLIALLGSAANQAFALEGTVNNWSQNGVEIGVGAGPNWTRTSISGVGSDTETTTAWQAFLGYKFNQYATIEAGYLSAGHYSVSDSDAYVGAHLHAIQASVVGTLPITQSFGVFARLGADYWMLDVNAHDSTGSASASAHTTEPLYGLGVQALFDGGIVRAEFQRSEHDDTVYGYHYSLAANTLLLSVVWLIH